MRSVPEGSRLNPEREKKEDTSRLYTKEQHPKSDVEKVQLSASHFRGVFRRNTDFVPGAGGAGNQKAMREVCQRRRNGRASTKMTAGAVRHAFPPNDTKKQSPPRVRISVNPDKIPILRT